MRREKFIDTARLATSCEGNLAFGKEAIEAFGNASEIFELGHREAVERFPPLAAIAGRLFSRQTADAAARDVDWAMEHGVEMVTIDSEDYPYRLRECPDPPLLLYLRGKCNFHRDRFIAIVGTRAATQYGRRYCDKIVEGLSKCVIKPVVVSGLALGIDTYAHTFALRYGLDTVAVMATGFDTIYPPSNYRLAEEIPEHGALVTEFSPFVPSYPVNFVRRNRIIAGLGDCTLVVESKKKGGGLITARLAQDYNRSVFAVPGRIDDNTFKGCNEIIEENTAAIVTGPDSIISAMGWGADDSPLPLDFNEGGTKGRIVTFLTRHPESDAETIAAVLGCSVRDLSIPLIELEMSGAISLVSGNKYCAN